MTRISYGPGLRMRIEGHAGAGKEGSDIVCAAASMLSWTLARAAEDEPGYAARVRIEEEPTAIEVTCEPTARAEEKCRYLFEIVHGGFKLLAESFPENVRLERADGDGERRGEKGDTT